MANPTYDQGWGYLEYGKRYGYTDGTLYYLGEPRITAQYTPAMQYVAKTYAQLQADVDAWIAADPINRATLPTRDIAKLDHHFDGPPKFADSTKYIYNQLGVPFPTPISIPDNVVKVFTDTFKGLSGIGFGFATPMYRAGFTYGQFFYHGECRAFRVRDLPVSSARVSPPAAHSSVGLEYFKASDGMTYIKNALGETFILYDWVPFMMMIDAWEKSALTVKTVEGLDIIQSGMYFTGQKHWQLRGLQCVPDDLVMAMNDPLANLHIILKYIPGGAASTTTTTTGTTTGNPVTVTLPSRRRYAGLDFASMFALSMINQGKRRKRGK